MNNKMTSLVALSVCAVLPAFSGESMDDKPRGFRFFNQHLTIKPYVSLSYTYDSNIDTARHSDSDSIFCVNPGADFDWVGDRWALSGNVWYRRNAYCKYRKAMGENGWGESLAYKWTTGPQTEKGWSLIIAEKYQLIDQGDSFTTEKGRGIWRDREAIDVSGALERRFTERLHADVQGQYNWLDYRNDTGKYMPLYGWSAYSIGLEAGYAASKWTDLLVAGGYTDYTQKGGTGYKHYSNDSQVWTVQAGLGTHATEKITYRVLVGASSLSYGGHSNVDSGWSYSLSSNWRATRQLQFSALGSSYYQPSERTLGQAIKVYSLSAGVSYLTFGDKLNLTGNIAWRYEESVYNDRYLAANEEDETILSARIGADYLINRWASVFANFTWEKEFCDNTAYEYDRYRFTVGVRFHY